jgi:hypothetical protein
MLVNIGISLGPKTMKILMKKTNGVKIHPTTIDISTAKLLVFALKSFTDSLNF